MVIYPAIDIRGGRCVRLIQGDYERESIYSQNPMDVALNWENKGAGFIHVVDLDGAKAGFPQNIQMIVEMCTGLKVPVQLGGGIRNMGDIDLALIKGVNRVILGTAAIRNQEFVKEAVKKYGDRIVIGIDAKDGMVAIEGWTKTSEFKAVEFGKIMEFIGVKTIIYTDISRDGMMKGPNIWAMEEMAVSLEIDVIASGGVSCLGDIKSLMTTGVTGVIIGKALYTGEIRLEDALRVAEV